MRIVKLSDLSEEERKKALEQQQARINANNAKREEIQKNVNQQFNELVNKEGAKDTSKHTTTYRNILNAMDSKEQRNSFKKVNGLTLWDTIKNTASDTGKIAENTFLGLKNGINSFQQNFIRNNSNIQANTRDSFNIIEERILNKKAEENPEAVAEIIQKRENNSLNQLLSGDKIRENTSKNLEKMQAKVEENNKKIQENTDSISNRVGKYLAGNIAPSIGQMAPRISWRTCWYFIFYWFSNRELL